METLGERIKKARLAKGWSQGKLAAAAGVSQGTIGNIEAGIRVEPRGLIEIASALGVRAQWVKTGELPQTDDPQSPSHKGDVSISDHLDAIDQAMRPMSTELMTAARATLNKWASGQLSGHDAGAALSALLDADGHRDKPKAQRS